MPVSCDPSTAGNLAVPSNFTILLAVVPVFTVATPAATETPEVSASVLKATTPLLAPP
ncbi:hypothetical protein D3C72_1277240 [compost metagenome]